MITKLQEDVEKVRIFEGGDAEYKISCDDVMELILTIQSLQSMNNTLLETLKWYLEDDKRQVENGILENINLRPASNVLGR